MSLKRTVSYFAVASSTFLVGFALLWFSQRQVNQPEKSSNLRTAESTVTTSIVEDQAPKESLFNEIKFPRVWSENETVAGKVEVVESDHLNWSVSLNGKEILTNDGSLPPSVFKHIRSRVSPFDEVLVLWQETGTCCEFGRFWFLGVKADKSYHLSTAIGEGFAHVPNVIVGSDYVKVKVRDGYIPNESKGEGFLPGGTWVLKNGRVRRQR